MEKLNHAITINAPKEKVWETLWNDATYRIWTGVFDPESHVEGALTEGNTVRFLGSSGNGMYAAVAKVVPNEYMSFKHLGELQNGQEKPYDTEVFENYTLTETDGVTEVAVEVDTPGEYKEMFEKLFPKALAKVKELAEK